MLADYDYYRNTYNGIVIQTESEYNYFAERASEELAQYPLSLVTDENATKKCQCRVADILYDVNKKNGKGIASESVGGYYSVSYSQADASQTAKLISNAVVMYLGKYILRSTNRVAY